jgi:hypothetical protein
LEHSPNSGRVCDPATFRDQATHLGRFAVGLIPNWAKDPKIAYKTINARAETVDTAPSYRQASRNGGAAQIIEIPLNSNLLDYYGNF